MTVRIVIDLADDTEGEQLALLLKAGVGNKDPEHGPVSILDVAYRIDKAAEIKPVFTFSQVHGKLEKRSTEVSESEPSRR